METIMSLLEFIALLVLPAIGAYFGAYLKKKGEQKAFDESLKKVTDTVEGIKLLHQKALSEHDIKLENFKKVVELRLTAFELIASLRSDIWKMFVFKKPLNNEVSLKFQELSTYLNTYLPFMADCEVEISSYVNALSDIEKVLNPSGKQMQPVLNALEMLMKKLVEYKNVQL